MVSFLRRDVIQFSPAYIWWKLAKQTFEHYPPKKQPIFLFLSLAVKSLHHLHKNLWRIITLLSPSCVKFITRSAICGYRNFASKLLSTSKNTLKISPNKKNSLSNLNLCINQAGNVQWPTRSHFNIITATKQLLKRVLKVWILNLWAVIFLKNPSQSNRQNVCKLFQNSYANITLLVDSPVLRTNLTNISVQKWKKSIRWIIYQDFECSPSF